MSPILTGLLQLAEFIVLFAFLVLASSGWGVLCCQLTKAPARFVFMLGFGVLSLLAYLTFFVFLVDTVTGRAMSCLVGFASVGLTVYQLSNRAVRQKFLDPDFWLPVLLLFLYAASSLTLLVLHGGNPRNAVSNMMPEDNYLPQILTDRLWNGGPVMLFHGMTLLRMDHLPSTFGDWLSSDRPPLLVALCLLCRPFEFLGFNPDEVYQMSATLFQATWIPAVYLLGQQLRLSRYALGFMLVWFAGSGFFLLHTLFTWPKLLAASLFLGGLSLLFFCADNLTKRNIPALMLLGVLWSLALLSHGGILFSLLAIPFLPAAWSLVKAHPKSVLAAAAVFILVSLPWSAYQNFYDPPGNRLIKMHMAGVDEIDARGSWETIRDSYGKLTFTDWLERRLGTVETTVLLDRLDEVHSIPTLQNYLNVQGFFRLDAVIGLLGVGYVAWIVERLRKKSSERTAKSLTELFWMNMGAYFIWIVLMFQPFGATVHQASFGMVILFMMIGAWWVVRLPYWASLSLLIGQWILFGLGWLFFFPAPVTMDVAWFGGLILYGVLAALFAASLWLFLPAESIE